MFHGMPTFGSGKSSVEKNVEGFQKNRKKTAFDRFCHVLSQAILSSKSCGRVLLSHVFEQQRILSEKAPFRVTTWMTACKFEVQGCGQ